MQKFFILSLLILGIACSQDEPLIELNRDLTIYIPGVDVEPTDVQIALQNADTLIISPLGYQPDNSQLAQNLGVVPAGTYEVTISIFSGEDLFADFQSAHTSMYQGTETVVEITVSGENQIVSIEGPDASGGPIDISATWSNRRFHIYDNPAITSLTLSFPTERCDVGIRVLPSAEVDLPTYAYVDYFVYSEANGSEALGFTECVEGCTLESLLSTFTREVVEESDIANCENNDWDLTDTYIGLVYGEDNLIIFYQRWDENGELIFPAQRDSGRTGLENISSRRLK